MVKDYSKIPCNVTLKNTDETDITIRVTSVAVTIPANDSIELTIDRSEVLALLKAKSENKELKLEVIFNSENESNGPSIPPPEEEEDILEPGGEPVRPQE